MCMYVTTCKSKRSTLATARTDHAGLQVSPCCVGAPYYLLSSHSLALAAFSLSQEEFVSKVHSAYMCGWVGIYVHASRVHYHICFSDAKILHTSNFVCSLGVSVYNT